MEVSKRIDGLEAKIGQQQGEIDTLTNRLNRLAARVQQLDGKSEGALGFV